MNNSNKKQLIFNYLAKLFAKPGLDIMIVCVLI